MSDIKISIIVPVYNVERYLSKCLDSLINQTLKEIEIICVNDESPDKCAEILNQYKHRDTRIIILNQKNSGQGSARNRGLEIAKGKYIQFLDSDDYYEPNCCEEMFHLMEMNDIDVACFDVNIIYDAYEDKKHNDNNYFKMKYRGKQKVRPEMAHQLVDVNCWNKIFRKSFVDRLELRFPEKLHYEDVGFFWFWITQAEYIYFHPHKLINYLRRTGSFLGEIFDQKSQTILDSLKVNELIYNHLFNNGLWEKYAIIYIQSYLLKIKWLINSFSIEDLHSKKLMLDTSANFLSQLHFDKSQLEAEDTNFLNKILTRNYYFFSICNTYEINHPKPIFDDSINIVFSSDQKYISYLSVTIQSIVCNSSSNKKYDIIILYTDLYDFCKRFILSIIKPYPNISIRFLNMNSYIKKYNIKNLFTVNHISIAAYYRLFIGKIFHLYPRILYLDSDLIVTKDISELYYENMGDAPIAACRDVIISNSLLTDDFNAGAWKYFKKYMYEKLNFSDIKNYFNSGVLLINIKAFNEVGFEHLLYLAENNNEFFHDQNVLNAAFNNNYYILNEKWNYQWNVKFHCKNYKASLQPNILSLYDDYDSLPYIIHYTSHCKPWNDPYHNMSDLWWVYARKSPFYEMIMHNFLRMDSKIRQGQTNSNQTIKKNRLKYIKYKLLSKITFGKMRKHYKKKKQDIKRALKK